MTEKLYEAIAQEESLFEYMGKKSRIGTLVMPARAM
jgi:hypothetical protein